MKPGDYLFVQFGHNDMKDKATNALAVYKSDLKKIVARTRATRRHAGAGHFHGTQGRRRTRHAQRAIRKPCATWRKRSIAR